MLAADAALLDATGPYVPHFQFALDDLGALSVDALATRTIDAFARLVQIAFWSSRSFERLKAAAPRMAEITASLRRDETTLYLADESVVLVAAARPVRRERACWIAWLAGADAERFPRSEPRFRFSTPSPAGSPAAACR